jgi:sugar diacid utilization regulator
MITRTRRSKALTGEKTIRQELEKRVAQLKALSRGQAIISTSIMDVQTVLQGMLDEQKRVLNADTAIIVLREGDTSMFRVAAVTGYGSREPAMLRVRIPFDENPILRETSRTHRGLIVADARRDPRVQNLAGSTDVERALMVAPLIFNGSFLGVTAVSQTTPGVYTTENLELLTLFANQAAIAIANAQLHEMLQKQRDEAQQRQMVHESLIAQVLDGGNVQAIATALAEQSGVAVEIQGVDGDPLAWGAPRDAMLMTRDAQICAPVIVQRQHLANVYFYGASHELGSSMQALAEQAGIVVALTLMREQAAREAERRLQEDLVEHLLADRMAEGSKFWLLAERLGWKAGCAAQVCVAVVEPAHEICEKRDVNSASLKERFAQLTYNWLGCHVPHALQIARNEEVIMLLPASSSQNAPRSIRETMRRLLEYVADELPEGLVTVGIGEQRQLMVDLHASYASAQQAVYLMRQLSRRGEALMVEDFGVLAVLVRATGRHELEHFAQQTLGSILSHPDLLTTLRLYLSSNGSLAFTAQQLFTHRNTVLYRLKQIEELLGVALSDGDTRLRQRKRHMAASHASLCSFSASVCWAGHWRKWIRRFLALSYPRSRRNSISRWGISV